MHKSLYLATLLIGAALPGKAETQVDCNHVRGEIANIASEGLLSFLEPQNPFFDFSTTRLGSEYKACTGKEYVVGNDTYLFWASHFSDGKQWYRLEKKFKQ